MKHRGRESNTTGVTSNILPESPCAATDLPSFHEFLQVYLRTIQSNNKPTRAVVQTIKKSKETDRQTDRQTETHT